MRLLVTGGAGYIGSVVSARLVADGHEVVVLDDLSTAMRTRGRSPAPGWVPDAAVPRWCLRRDAP